MKADHNPFEPPKSESQWLLGAAVAAVVVAALGAAVMAQRAPAIKNTPAVAAAVGAPVTRPDAADTTPVVSAPALKPVTTRVAMGAPAACADCGVVQMVVAVSQRAKADPTAYEMHIRMDDGSMRTVTQRGAMAPGSRVRVEGSTVHALLPG